MQWMDVDTALSEVPINLIALIDDTDFKSREESVTYNQAGLDLVWCFTTTAGVYTQTAVTPTDTAGDYDWVNQGNGDYTIEIPATGGASINNDTEGFGHFKGFATGILPWSGPTIGFRAAAINNALINGGDNLDVNTIQWAGTATSAGVGGDGLPASIALADRNAYLIEALEGGHTWQGNYFYVDPVNGDTHASGNRGGRTDPYKTLQDCHDEAVTDSNHDVIFLVAGHASTVTTHTIAGTTTLSKRYLSVVGPGRDFIITRTGSGDTLAVTGDGVSLSGFQVGTAGTGSGHGIKITDADFVKIEHVWILDTRGDGIHILRGSNCVINLNTFQGTGVAGSGDGVHIVGTAGVSTNNRISLNVFSETAGDSILIEQGTTNDTLVTGNLIHDAGGWAINIGASSTDAVIHGNIFGNNASGNITDAGTTTIEHHNDDWASAAEIATVDTVVDGIQTDLSNATDGLGALKTLIDIVNTDLSNGTDGLGALKALIDALNNISAADVNTQVVDVLKTDTVTLPGQEAPPLTPTFEEMLSWVYKVMRNRKDQTATLWQLYADNETTVDAKATVSSDGTIGIKQEIVSGP